ncbi:Fibrinogen-like protein A,Ryncolin-4,Angiopoietin-related protein 7,Ficolin-3,Ficolin-1-B,Ficolin-2,Ryncolin-1,Tenascin-R,Fibrinogen-like protein 1,Ficolin-1,Fibrinogen C domain-containing protein 1-A,Tenascin-X,Tenascin-N,Ryncolin-3,Fibrinogen C domain-containing protein 1,Ryncolin-2,Techylectin-5B,Angiopoietin-related protein 2,Microfibril-associated glycoprotein 4,Tenascin,Fibrinogen C domain-containing protein 1-B [Mytilus coruscus]|uniref:Fibrinogen C-terminal domain-containing protein n=1 Tax=Mytilus coruscus TaxID=42192 RepID=A0A6J8C328_MYTCO|nr:Fibrinogen-like protein A,Ryncolin-4,Angiopoietin-related protein 7,Ficolin-3,Ficolin-1-B,Ficolin-2,Ryncolin-1,Tenascin-R,Fibrinogen-like protein 1,Ficolin-1,Fibrinogen C domain-containing protein 1-A,Tenascin-X,Tenascin-N,Ryncolin-3,Fibrinogen C domain-containing protein 1,Ryncolin-2,Techylectin-5B,Angiopoietin-related protein 2,Microfibril-associated glycoprotein 4,Tenascin,Fibrinogen C domain-containing protein 1-B [Mytilus coruscus]
MFKMLIYGFAWFWLTSVTTLETESDVEVRLLDKQNASLMATFDMFKAYDRVKQFVGDAIKTKMTDIEKNFNQQIENIGINLTVHFTVNLREIINENEKTCPLDYCLHNGTCTVVGNSFNCVCLGGYNGSRCEEKTKITKLRPRDCEDIMPKEHNGIYTIFPISNDNGFEVYCDFKTDNGNWTVFQRRINGQTDFFRGWEAYENGFGNLEAEFWLGNRKINELTSKGRHELRVDLTDFDGNTGFAKYSTFCVGNGSTNYKLTVSGYSGNLGDSLPFNNGMSFTTRDRDNDRSVINCANIKNGAWWYKYCTYVNLNGKYLQGGRIDGRGITWYKWKSSRYSVKSSVMMLRKVH